MGYTTDFSGAISIEPPISDAHAAYINKFSETRRMKRNPQLAEALPDSTRTDVGLPIGDDGGYFVGGGGFAGQEHDNSIVNYNDEPKGQPGLWCQWIVEDGELFWNGGEKFYHYTEWLEYLIKHFFAPWGYKLNGQIRYQGEDSDDRGVIYVKDNAVQQVADVITQPEPSW